MSMSLKLKPSRCRAAWGLLAIALLWLVAAQGCTSSDQDVNGDELAPAPKVGRLAPDFTLSDLEGDQVSLSDFRGKTVLLNFWATWCPACRVEMPDIEAMYQKYKDKDVAVIGVDLLESKGRVFDFVQRGGYSWVFVIDAKGEVARDYRIIDIPTSFFVDSEGIIRAVNIGAMSEETIEAKLASAMR